MNLVETLQDRIAVVTLLADLSTLALIVIALSLVFAFVLYQIEKLITQ